MIRRAAFLQNGLRSQPGLGSLLSRAKHFALALAVTCLGAPALALDAPPSRHEVVFVESNVADHQTLLKDVDRGAEVHVLDASRDGLAQIAGILRGQHGIDAIHIVSHGSEGAVQLGELTLTAQNLNSHATDLAAIGKTLKQGGDILLYGCDVAAGSDGAALVDALAQATQADIAASTDATGATAKGGNWALEKQVGQIDVIPGAVFDPSQYGGTLVAITFDYEANVTGLNTKDVRQTTSGETLKAVSVSQILVSGSGYGSPMVGTESLSTDWGTGAETSITFSLVSGNIFDLTSIGLGEVNATAENLTFTSSKGTATYTLPAGGGTTVNTFDVSAHANAANFQGITSFTITTADNSMYMSFDSIALANITAPAPTVTDARISISGASGSAGAYKIGDTVTATWNNTAGGDNNAGVTGVTMDFSAFGGGAAVAASNSGGTWTATYTIVSGAIDGTNKNVSVTATAASGSTTTADSTNATVDNVAPTVTDGNISISGASGTAGAYKIGDTVTATWNNTAGGDNNADTISGVTVDFSAFGGGAAVAASNSGGTWTATYAIVSGAIDGTNRNVSVTATDNAGNTTTTADTSNATLDNVAPTVTDARISIGGGSGAGGAFRDGDTVTATWNNTAGGDNNADTISGVTVNFSAFGGGAAVAATNSAGTWTATYGITPASTSGINKNVSVTATDNAGNAITAADTSNATVDNVVPGTPTGVSASAGDTQASVTFTAPASSGSSAITTYTATSNPGGLTGTCAASPCTVAGLTNGTAYTFTVTATNGAGTGSASAASNSVTPKAAQTITFNNPGAQSYGTTPTLSATASSGLTPTFSSSTTGVCTITAGGALTFVTSGTCTIDADQAGNGTYSAAPTVTQSFTVNAVVPGTPTIGTATAGDTQASVTFSAPASNGGSAITGYTATSNPGGLTGTCAASPCTVTGLTNGTAYTFTVTATNAAGTGSASAASNPVTPKAAQTITFNNPGAQSYGTTPTLSATATSGLTVSFTSSTTGVCTITSGGALTFVTTGTCTINADQAGNGSFLAASTVSRSFTVAAVAPGAPTIGGATAGDTQATVSFSAPAFTGGAAITGYTATSSPGGVTGTCAASPCTVTGLTNGVAYTFTVTATNSAGTGSASAASNSVTPNPGPAVVSVAVPANGTYRTGQNLDFTVTWDQNTTVTGTPRIALVIGATTVQANYVSSPTATTSLFRYTVLAGQTDNDGIAVGALTLNGGTIRNASNTDATLTLNSVGSTAGVLVDATAPTLPAANIVVNNQADPHKVVLTFSENLDNATLGAANTWTVTANGGSPTYSIASVALAAGNEVTLTLSAVNVTAAATTITNVAANTHLKVTPPATLADTAGNAYGAGLVTEAGATHVLDSTAPTLAGVATSSPTTSGGTLAATASEKALGYWIAVASGAAAPTVGQVKAGVNYGAVTVAAHGSGALPAASAGSLGLTGLSASTSYDIHLVAEDAAGNPSAAVATASLTTSAAPAAGGNNGPIPPLGTQPFVPGIGSQPAALDLSGGNGPAMANCLMDTLRQQLGGTPVYQGQTAAGVVKIGWNGQVLSFYPLDASTSSQGVGIHLSGANPLSVVTGCGTFSTVPALANLNEFGAILNGMGLSAQINAQGVITVWVNGTYYVVRPDYLVTPGTPGAPSLVMGEDGLFRFTDSAGNSQVLHPAFLDPDALQGQLYLLGGSIVVQTDGTALLVFGGQQYILVPDLTLGGVPPEYASLYWWQDGPAHYRYRNAESAFVNTSQGFTVRSSH